MSEPAPTALDQILETARTALKARHADTLERAERIRVALDAYVTALAQEVATEFASKNGLVAPPGGQSPIGAALALRAAVESLPELRSRLSGPAEHAQSSDSTAPAHAARTYSAAPSGTSTATPARGVAVTPIVEHVITRHVPAPPPSASWRSASADDHDDAHAAQPAAPAPAPSRPDRRPAELDPIANALIRDVQALDLTRMPSHQFRIWAEELAARARALQDKGADPDEVPGRVIRKLTAIAYEKGIGDIFGLNRKHSANWDEVAERARVRREAALANASAAAERADKVAADKLAADKAASVEKAAADRAAAAEKAALKAAAAAELVKKGEKEKAEKAAQKAAKGPDSGDAKAPEKAPDKAPDKAPEKAEALPPSSTTPKKGAPAPESDADPQSGKRELPLLRAIAKKMPVIFVGGVVKQEKVALIRQKHGVDIEWIDTSRHGTQAISGLEKRIRERRLAAVVVLQGLIGHKHFEPIVAAARQVGVPFAYADKAGLGSVVRAFTEVEKQLADGAHESQRGHVG